MYQHSCDATQGNKKFAKYFLINNKSTLLVSGDANTNEVSIRDVRAEWLGLPSNFSGFLTLCPEQHQAGFWLEYNQDFGTLFDLPFLRNSHVSIIIPYVHAENNLHLSQSNIQNPGTNPGMPRDILEAFRQPNWHNSKIDGKTAISQFTEVRIQFWRCFMDEDDWQLAYYSGFIIPTNKPNPTFLFNAVAGNGGQAGINAGVVLQVPFTLPDACQRIMWFMDLDATFRFHNHQWRTYDLRDRPWSRFLLFTSQNNPNNINIPGVNVLTLHSKVRSYALVDFATGLRYRNDLFTLEIGYTMWAHSKEHVKPDCRLIFDKGIQGNFSPGAQPQSANFSTIARQAPNDPVFVQLEKSDINIHSAATPGALVNGLTIAGGLQYSCGLVTLGAGMGGFVEWSRLNSPLDSWGLWGKCTISF